MRYGRTFKNVGQNAPEGKQFMSKKHTCLKTPINRVNYLIIKLIRIPVKVGAI